MEHANCPFCGQVLSPTPNGYQHVYVAEDECFLGGVHIGSKLMFKWNERADVLNICYTIGEDGYPVFNKTNKGRPLDADTLNKFFRYLKDNPS